MSYRVVTLDTTLFVQGVDGLLSDISSFVLDSGGEGLVILHTTLPGGSFNRHLEREDAGTKLARLLDITTIRRPAHLPV